MLTFLEEFPDHISSLFRSSKNIILGDFNIPWNKPENSDTISMQEILDMHDQNQHIHTQTHKLRNALDLQILSRISQTRTTSQTTVSLNGNSKSAEKLVKRYQNQETT